jgi:hypothetical protein
MTQSLQAKFTEHFSAENVPISFSPSQPQALLEKPVKSAYSINYVEAFFIKL